MSDSYELDERKEESIYTFRFSRNDEIVNVIEEEVNCIPYLSHLIKYNNNCSSIRNEDGEYLLDYQIRYNWFMPIFESARTGHPSALFSELSHEANVFGMLQLYDYLCLNPIPLPLLKDQCLVRTKGENIDKEKCRIEYRRSKNRLEVRDTAAQLIFGLIENEYDFNDSNTIERIFSLILIIEFLQREDPQRIYFNQSLNLNEERKKLEAKSARSGHFNTQPQRPKIDKFKHRVGPKVPKHR